MTFHGAIPFHKSRLVAFALLVFRIESDVLYNRLSGEVVKTSVSHQTVVYLSRMWQTTQVLLNKSHGNSVLVSRWRNRWRKVYVKANAFAGVFVLLLSARKWDPPFLHVWEWNAWKLQFVFRGLPCDCSRSYWLQHVCLGGNVQLHVLWCSKANISGLFKIIMLLNFNP